MPRSKGSKDSRQSGKWIQSAVHPSKKGSFTAYCGGKVTSACIQKGIHSPNKTTQARAKFAKAMRRI